MAFDAFIKIDGIPGESKDDKHPDWIEILSYSFDIDQPPSYSASTAGGATAERVDFGPLTVTKEVDLSTPKLFEAATTGKHIKEIKLQVCRAGGDKQTYLEIVMEQVLISAYKHGGGSGVPIENVTFSPGRFKITYSQQQREDGRLGGNVAAGWDLIANKFFA
jgi:type VI secretion system secreted protein Hcp